MQTLLNHKAAINSRFQNGFTPLLIAIVENHVEIVSLLLSSGADPTITDEDGQVPNFFFYSYLLKKDALALARESQNRMLISIIERETKNKKRRI